MMTYTYTIEDLALRLALGATWCGGSGEFLYLSGRSVERLTGASLGIPGATSLRGLKLYEALYGEHGVTIRRAPYEFEVSLTWGDLRKALSRIVAAASDEELREWLENPVCRVLWRVAPVDAPAFDLPRIGHFLRVLHRDYPVGYSLRWDAAKSRTVRWVRSEIAGIQCIEAHIGRAEPTVLTGLNLARFDRLARCPADPLLTE